MNYGKKKQMIIEWVWNKKGFAFPKTETSSTTIHKKKKVNEKTKRRKR